MSCTPYSYPYQRPMEYNQFLSTARLVLMAMIEGEEIERNRSFLIELKQMVSTIDGLLPDEEIPDWVKVRVSV